MAQNSIKVLIKPIDPEAYNHGTVTQSPRTATARDLESACANLEITADAGIPYFVKDFAWFLLCNYFVEAHQSGLYNRQIKLWESLSKVTELQCKTLEKGFISKTKLPVHEIAVLTQNKQPVVMALYIEPSYRSHGSAGGSDSAYLDLVRNFLARVAKVQARLGAQGIKGIFIIAPAPFPDELLRYVLKAVGAENPMDPVARFDSLLPAPYYVHINLIEHGIPDSNQIDSDRDDSEDEESSPLVKKEMRLLHPLMRAKRVPTENRLNSAQITYK